MCMCIHVSAFVSASVYVAAHASVSVSVYVSVFVSASVYVSVFVSASVYVAVHVSVYASVSVVVYVYVCVQIRRTFGYAHIHVYECKYTNFQYTNFCMHMYIKQGNVTGCLALHPPQVDARCPWMGYAAAMRLGLARSCYWQCRPGTNASSTTWSMQGATLKIVLQSFPQSLEGWTMHFTPLDKRSSASATIRLARKWRKTYTRIRD